MYRSWDFDAKTRPSQDDLNRHLESLASRWVEIVGEEIGRATRPLRFTGIKARRLLVYADANVRPPWGDWGRRSKLESERRTFTNFREALNRFIEPHEIDHVDFTTNVNSIE
jgi:Dna[CI] antecedent, DciA